MADTGAFTSPNYPKMYTSNLNCSWLIDFETSTGVMLKFNNIQTQQNYDVITVYDGPSTSSRKLARISGLIGDYPLVQGTPSSTKMLVLFNTNYGLDFQGFQASFFGLYQTKQLKCSCFYNFDFPSLFKIFK